MASCAQCGTHNADDARFCAQCGAPITPAMSSGPPANAGGVPAPPSAPQPPYVPPQPGTQYGGGQYGGAQYGGTQYGGTPYGAPQFARPASRGPNWLLFGCIGCAVLVIVILAAAGILGSLAVRSVRDMAQNANPAGSVRGPANAPHTTIAYGGRTLNAVTVDDVDYAVTSARVTTTIGGVSTATTHVTPVRANGRFVVLHLLARDRARTSQTIVVGRAVLIDATGNQYAVSAPAQAAMTISGDPEAMVLVNSIEPGMNRFFKLVFDVPPDRKRFTLRIRHGILSRGPDGALPVSL